MLFSVTDPQYRVKPAGVSDVSLFFPVTSYKCYFLVLLYIFSLFLANLNGSLYYQIMWAEAMGKLEGMESTDRERLWPQLVQGFKDLSQRLKVLFVSLKHIRVSFK